MQPRPVTGFQEMDFNTNFAVVRKGSENGPYFMVIEESDGPPGWRQYKLLSEQFETHSGVMEDELVGTLQYLKEVWDPDRYALAYLGQIEL